MPTKRFELPTGELVLLIYGAKYPAARALYLQAIRSGRATEDSHFALEYHAMKETYARGLADAALAEVGEVDALLTSPSSRADAEPYRDAISSRAHAEDLGGRFARKGIVKASEGASIDELIEEFTYEPNGREGDIRKLLIVDESIASGKTVASLLKHLRAAGLPTDCRVTVAVWALLQE